MLKKVVCIEQTVKKELFGNKNPIGKTIKINRLGYEVIGILAKKGNSTRYDQDDIIITPVITAMTRILENDYVSSIDVEITRENLIEPSK